MKKTYVMIFLLLFALTGCSEEKTDILPENESQQEEYMKEEKSEWTSLSEEELAWFNTSFFNSTDKEIVNSFLDSVYSDVKDIDLYRLFYPNVS